MPFIHRMDGLQEPTPALGRGRVPWQRNAESSVGSPSGVLDFADVGFAVGAWTAAVACTAMLVVVASRTRAIERRPWPRMALSSGPARPRRRSHLASHLILIREFEKSR